ncbi:Tpr-related protein family member, putative [Theileria annulata]|uniref:Tpr-related protein family member, putative n=1 Tax=Theileria annulata TaxID=5874 RepID=Q4U8U1_THEAN|nr:Tpr-related protein family member, putative [Theileria annulata]CAI76762.1 Tpr-related protein family member, putative [Theileria annulata]|eukprot:XP_953387.1 Tpr-related protein family member, putative [Theileria annulata]
MAEFGKDPLKVAAYMFAGLSMMLNIRLVYSSAPYALLRFKLPENLFSVFVRIMAGSLELWCLPSMTLGNILDFIRKQGKLDDNTKRWLIDYQSIFWSWANFFTFVILLFVYIGGDQGHLTAFYWVIAASGFVFGIYMVMVYALEFQYLAWYMVGENSFPMVTSLMHYIGTLLFGNRRKYNSDYIIVYIDIVMSLGISLVAAALWTMVYKSVEQEYPPKDPKQRNCIRLSTQPSITTSGSGANPEIIYTLQQVFVPHSAATSGSNSCGFQKSAGYYGHLLSPSLMVLVGMGLVYSIYPGIAPGMIVPFYLIDKIEMVLLIATAVPPVLIAILKQSNPDYNPYVYLGNWGYEHLKSCKGGGTPDTKGDCKDCTSSCEADSGLKLKDNLTLGATGNPVTLTNGNFTANAAITITTKAQDVDFKNLTVTNNLTISSISGSIKKTDGRDLERDTRLNNGEVLILNANGQINQPDTGNANVTLAGTIKVTSSLQKLGDKLNFVGGPNSGISGSLSLANGSGNITSGTLTINRDGLETLKTATGTLSIGTGTPDTPVTYKLVTKDTIIIGLDTLKELNGATNAKVTLTGLPLLPITIAPSTAGDGISATLTDVTFSQTDGNFGGLKNSGAGLTLNLTQAFNGAQITRKDGQALKKDDTLDKDTVLKLEGSSTGGTIQINANIKVISRGKLNSVGSTTYTLKGGIEGQLNNLQDASGNNHVTGNLTITNIKYDSNEIHDKHKDTMCCYFGKVYKWSDTSKYYGWHSPLILAPLQICLAAIFIYSLHYRDSAIARSIINQPKMSTALSIVFYMCHEILLAAGFPGIAPDDNVLLPMQLIGAYLMVLLAYYSVGYITEYKRHDPFHWPTDGMTKWNALCYWLKMASKITNKNFKQLFTTDLRRDLLIIIFKCVNWVNRKSKSTAYIL